MPANSLPRARSCTADQIAALERAIANVDTFHRAALPTAVAVEVQPGRALRAADPPDRRGRSVRAGRLRAAALHGDHAGGAGAHRRLSAARAVHAAAARWHVPMPRCWWPPQLCGIEQVFKIGGAQAIAAMAYGTASVPKVAKIFGPGNAWVTAAKQLVAADPDGAALDLPAGPSEVLVIADDSARAEFVAADLLAQAEHDPQSQAMLVTTSAALAHQVAEVARAAAARRCRAARSCSSRSPLRAS